MYRENKPSFQNAAFKRMNNKWVQEKDMCKLYDSVLCYVMKERTKATYHQDPKVPFRFRVEGCDKNLQDKNASAEYRVIHAADTAEMFGDWEGSDWITPPSCHL
mmetsp:Transcript_45877/g.76454  ORF Transcript_45877/g.76454 Transcript_45877/m.76454 type:complete len:104 (+) Transcript_45877:110-421(+)